MFSVMLNFILMIHVKMVLLDMWEQVLTVVFMRVGYLNSSRDVDDLTLH